MRPVGLLATGLLLLATLPEAGSQQQGRIEVSALEVRFEVTPIGFLLSNTTITFKAVNGSATVQTVSLEYPVQMQDIIQKRAGEPVIYWRTSPKASDAGVRIDFARSRNRTIFELNPGSNRLLEANGEFKFAFWLYLRDGVKAAPSTAQSYLVPMFQPAIREKVGKFEFGLVAPLGISPVAGVKFDNVTRLAGKSIHFNTTLGVVLKEPRQRTATINGTGTSSIPLLQIPLFERKFVMSESGTLLLKETILIENRGGGSLESLPVNLPGGVTTFEVLPPPPPYPGFKTIVKVMEGKLDLRNITRSVRPGQKGVLTYQYSPPKQMLITKADSMQISIPVRLPIPGIAEESTIGLDAPWVPGVPSRMISGLTDFEEGSFIASVPVPLAAGASSVVGAGVIGFLAILAGALLLPQLSPGIAIRKRVPQLQRIIVQRTQKDKELVEGVQRFLKGEASLDELRRGAARIQDEREPLLSEWADLRPILAEEKELPMDKLSNAERAYEKAFTDLMSLAEQLMKGAMGKEAFERQWPSLARRLERQAREMEEAMNTLVSKIEEPARPG